MWKQLPAQEKELSISTATLSMVTKNKAYVEMLFRTATNGVLSIVSTRREKKTCMCQAQETGKIPKCQLINNGSILIRARMPHFPLFTLFSMFCF